MGVKVPLDSLPPRPQKPDVDNVPPLPPSRRVFLWRALCALLFCSAAGFLATVLSFAIWILLYEPETANPDVLAAALLVASALSLLAFVFCLIRGVRGTVTMVGFVLTTGALAFLATDDLYRSEAPDYGPVAAPDSAEFLTYLRMAHGTPGSITQMIAAPAKNSDLFLVAKPAEWKSFLDTNHARILSEWENDTVGQAWLSDMANLPPGSGAIVHFTTDSPIIAFQPLRALVSHRLAYALLIAGEGDTDRAAAHLIELLHACHALGRIGVGPIDEMISIVFAKKTYECISYLLERTALTAGIRAELIHALEAAPDIGLISTRTILGEAQTLRSITDRIRHGELQDAPLPKSGITQRLLPSLSRFILHPYRMERELLEFYQSTNTLIASRRLEEAKSANDEFVGRTRSFTSLRNPGGRKLAAMATPAFNKIGAKLWETEDARRALLERLKAQSKASHLP